MKRLKRKLRAKNGETLMETLVALLVVVMSSVLLLTMTSSAGRLNKVAQASDATLFSEVNAAQRKLAGSELPGQVTITIAGQPLLPDGTVGGKGPVTTVSVDVNWYGGIGKIQTYQMPEGGGGT